MLNTSYDAVLRQQRQPPLLLLLLLLVLVPCVVVSVGLAERLSVAASNHTLRGYTARLLQTLLHSVTNTQHPRD